MNKAVLKDGTLAIDCEMFIIPNSLNRASTFLCNAGRFKESANVILTANGLETESDPVLMQVWIVADSMECDNLNDHIGVFTAEDGSESFYGQVWSYLPASLFKNAKEGDTVTVHIPAGVYGYSREFETVLNTTLSQKKFRYRDFGAFEAVFERLYSKIA